MSKYEEEITKTERENEVLKLIAETEESKLLNYILKTIKNSERETESNMIIKFTEKLKELTKKNIALFPVNIAVNLTEIIFEFNSEFEKKWGLPVPFKIEEEENK